MKWNLYKKEKFLEPLKFSNGKTQKDVVEEILKEIEKGERVIFIHGKCGTGKSAIALNLAKEIGKTSIVVPGKNLQQQYKKDYENEKYILKENNEKLKISVITGRKNHKCKFLEDNKEFFSESKQEKNSSLLDIFSKKRDSLNKEISDDSSADNNKLPCKIEIKEKNMWKIREYLKQNKKVNIKNFEKISDVKRMSIAPICPYWSPVFPEEYEINLEAEKKKYLGLNNTMFTYYKRKPGCSFYEQFQSHIDSDVIVFNSLKYQLESLMNRKPATEVEIIDECDEFLDSFSNIKKINVDRLLNSLNSLYLEDIDIEKVKEMQDILIHLKKDKRVNESKENSKILKLRETGIYDLFKILLEDEKLLKNIDEESYVFDVENIAKMFKEFFNETFIIFEEKNESLIANIVTINLSKKFSELLNKNKILVLMSGTLHSKEVLRDIFGIENFKIIEAETKHQGKIKIKRKGNEKNCKYSNFYNGSTTRGEYLKNLDECVESGKKPCLVQINGYNDLPSEEEIKELNLKNLINKEKLKKLQFEDKTGERVKEFKLGKFDVLFTTKDSRGVDFPGEECNSVVFTKYPNPDVKDPFWKILSKTKPTQYWKFYKDKAKREVYQKVYRGLRSEKDYVEVLSPDSRVLEEFEEMEKEKNIL